MTISSILFEACLFTSITLLLILGYKMLKFFVNIKYGTIQDQLVLYLTGMMFLLVSNFNLPVDAQIFYQYACVCYLGISPYYLTIEGR